MSSSMIENHNSQIIILMKLRISFKLLPLLALYGTLGCGSRSVAAGVGESLEQLTLPTLTGLNLVDSALYPEPSAYQLVKVSEANPAEYLSITKYLLDPDTGGYSAVEFNVDFAQPLGDAKPSDDNYTYFQWQQDNESKRWHLAKTRDSSSADFHAYSSSNKPVFDAPAGTDISNSFLAISVHSSSDSKDTYSQGGAIFNDEISLGKIAGDFIANRASSSGTYSEFDPSDGSNIIYSYAQGGAIYNSGSIESITGSFVGNYAESTSSETVYITFRAQGGAIYNSESARVDSITGDFIANIASASADLEIATHGGAIYNSVGSSIGKITGDFIANSASSFTSYTKAEAYGGAIYNDEGSSVGDIQGDFIANTAVTIGDECAVVIAYGGAIYNHDGSSVGDIQGDFVANAASATTISYGDVYARGGAMMSLYSTVGSISGDFIANTATALASTELAGYAYARGGAIWNLGGTVKSISGDFMTNSAMSYITDRTWTESELLSGYGAHAYGGAINNSVGTIALLALDRSMQFTGNYTSVTNGVEKNFQAIYNSYDAQGIDLSRTPEDSSIHFNAYGSNSIVMNDGIDGHSDAVAKQILHINSGLDGEGAQIAPERFDYATVAFNSKVENQTVIVYAGQLALGEFAGATLQDAAGKDLVVEQTQAHLSNVVLDIREGGTLTAFNASALGSTNTITNSGMLSIAEGTLGNTITQAGGTLRTAGALSLSEGISISVTGEGNVIEGSTAASRVSGGSITLMDKSELRIESISLTSIQVQTEGSAKLTLHDVTLAYDRVSSSSTMSLTRASDAQVYTLTGVELGAATFTGSLTLDVDMMDEQLAAFNEALSSGTAVTLHVDGLADTTLAEGLRVSLSINGESYDAQHMGAGVDGLVFSIIPEPSSATLSLLALAGLLARRRRRSY